MVGQVRFVPHSALGMVIPSGGNKQESCRLPQVQATVKGFRVPEEMAMFRGMFKGIPCRFCQVLRRSRFT